MEGGNGMNIREWLTKYCKLPQYIETFESNGFETTELVVHIRSIDDLRLIGITKLGHQLALYNKIQILQKQKKSMIDVGPCKSQSLPIMHITHPSVPSKPTPSIQSPPTPTPSIQSPSMPTIPTSFRTVQTSMPTIPTSMPTIQTSIPSISITAEPTSTMHANMKCQSVPIISTKSTLTNHANNRSMISLPIITAKATSTNHGNEEHRRSQSLPINNTNTENTAFRATSTINSSSSQTMDIIDNEDIISPTFETNVDGRNIGHNYCESIDIKLNEESNTKSSGKSIDIAYITKNGNFAHYIINNNIKCNFDYSGYPNKYLF